MAGERSIEEKLILWYYNLLDRYGCIGGHRVGFYLERDEPVKNEYEVEGGRFKAHRVNIEDNSIFVWFDFDLNKS